MCHCMACATIVAEKVDGPAAMCDRSSCVSDTARLSSSARLSEGLRSPIGEVSKLAEKIGGRDVGRRTARPPDLKLNLEVQNVCETGRGEQNSEQGPSTAPHTVRSLPDRERQIVRN